MNSRMPSRLATTVSSSPAPMPEAIATRTGPPSKRTMLATRHNTAAAAIAGTSASERLYEKLDATPDSSLTAPIIQ